MIPSFLVEKLNKQYGNSETNSIIENFSNNICTSFRINMTKTNLDKVLKELEQAGIPYKKIVYDNTAIVLEPECEGKIEELEIYKNGEIYMQSLSSMIPPIVLEPKPKETILDMCAAPGGKTTQMAMLSNNEALITACERNTIRAERLKYNIEKQSAKGIVVINKDARDLDDFFSFDKILLDAPCSGSGTLFKNVPEGFTEILVEKSSKTQFALLSKAIKLIKKNGEIVYSTCSILKDENEDILNKILEKYKNIEIVPIEHEFFNDMPKLKTTIEGTICLKPTELYEGFFVAKVRKNA